MPSNVQNSLFGPLLPPAHADSPGLAAENAQSATAGSTQTHQADRPKSQTSGSDRGTFRDALKRAGRHQATAKPDRHVAKAAPKPAKVQPAARRPDKQRGDTDQRQASISSDGRRQPARPASQKATTTTDGHPADSQHAQAESASHPSPPHAPAEGQSKTSRQPAGQIPAQHQPAKPAGQSSQREKVQENAPAQQNAQTTIRAVDHKAGPPTSDPASDNVPTDATPAGSDPTQDAPLTAVANPGSALAIAGGVTASGAATPGARARPANPGNGADSSTQDSSATAVQAAGGISDDIDLLTSVTATDPSTDAAAPAGKSATKPGDSQPSDSSPFAQMLSAVTGKESNVDRPAAIATPEPAPEAQFAQANHDKIVTGVRGELLPNGGTMHLRLDPPELGDLQISIHMRDGVMTAAFHTTNDEATRLLSHSLVDLKATLEAQGVNVDKLHVQQGPRSNTGDSRDSGDSARRDSTPEQRQSDRREQQRKDLIQKMWDKLAGKAPVDLVA